LQTQKSQNKNNVIVIVTQNNVKLVCNHKKLRHVIGKNALRKTQGQRTRSFRQWVTERLSRTTRSNCHTVTHFFRTSQSKSFYSHSFLLSSHARRLQISLCCLRHRFVYVILFIGLRSSSICVGLHSSPPLVYF